MCNPCSPPRTPTFEIKAIPHLYQECQNGAYISAKLKADDGVKIALDSQLQREKTWKRKRSSVVQSENALQEDQPNLPTEISESDVKKIKKSVNKTLNEEMKDHWINHMKSLVVQGDFISAVDTMDSDHNYTLNQKTLIICYRNI